MAAISAVGWITPVSLLARETTTSGRPTPAGQVFIRSSSQSRSIRPLARTGQPSAMSPLVMQVAKALACSAKPTTGRRKPAAMALSIAKALASVPPLVKVTEPSLAPTRLATWPRARSIAARAVRPAEWTEEGLPPIARAQATASAASIRIGAVAL